MDEYVKKSWNVELRWGLQTGGEENGEKQRRNKRETNEKQRKKIRNVKKLRYVWNIINVLKEPDRTRRV